MFSSGADNPASKRSGGDEPVSDEPAGGDGSGRGSGPAGSEAESSDSGSSDSQRSDGPPVNPPGRGQPRIPPPPGHRQPAPDRTGGGQGSRTTDPAFPEDLVRVTPWPDPVLDRLGHDPRSGYVERYWLSILGPSCLLLLRRLASELEQQPDGFDLDTVRWASELGIGMKGGKNGPFWRAIERGCRFGAAQRNGNRLAVRRRLPPLTARQVERLPPSLQSSHHQWAEARLQRSRRPSVVKWSPYRDDGPDEQPPEAHPLDDAA
ncbi:MAG: hypothetical protein ACR2QK_05615 [Acidimicrobiales bacterium]